MTNHVERIAAVLSEHQQSVRNRRCKCGWRPTWPDERIGAEYFQHREHLAWSLADALIGSLEDSTALDKIAHLVKEDCEGEGWTDMPGIIESISDAVDRTGRDVSPHE